MSHGFIHEDLANSNVRHHQHAHDKEIEQCSQPALNDACFTLLKSLSFDEEMISFDEYWFNYTKAINFVYKYKRFHIFYFYLPSEYDFMNSYPSENREFENFKSLTSFPGN